MRTIGVSLLACMLCAGVASATIIDDYDTGDFDTGWIPPGADPWGPNVQAGAGIIGGTRTTTFDHLSGTGGVGGEGSRAAVTTGDLYVINNPGDTTHDSQLIMDYPLAAATDLTPDTHFSFDVVSLDNNTLMVAIEVTDLDSSDEVTTNFPGPLNNQSAVVAFADFTGIDFTNVTNIKVTIDGDPGYDVQIDAFETTLVPEPLTVGMLSMAFVGLGGYVRRRRRA